MIKFRSKTQLWLVEFERICWIKFRISHFDDMYIRESQKKLLYSTLVQYEVERSIFWIPQQIKIIMPGMKLLTPDPIGDHNRPFAIGSKFSLKTNTFSFQKKLLASELWKLFMFPYFALILPSIWQICRYSTLTTDILEKSVICSNFGFITDFGGNSLFSEKV